MPAVTVLTNTFSAGTTEAGALLLQQRVGTNTPVFADNPVPLPDLENAALTVGVAEQWQFYVFTNETAFTNAAFLIFLPALTNPVPANASLQTAIDLDLYVSRDPAITNLDAAALAAADKSFGRGGTETLIYSNATPGAFYLGVKCESQQEVEFGLMAVVSELPFAETDPAGNQLLRGLATPVPIPGGTPASPGAAYVFGLSPEPIPVRRVILTNTLSHPDLGELSGVLTHDNVSVGLLSRATNTDLVSHSFVYDDSGEGDIAGAQPSDGPGSLRAFGGHSALGQWQLTWQSTHQPGTNEQVWLWLERQPDLANAATATVLPGACRQEFLQVPAGATNLTVMLTRFEGTGPLTLQVCPADSSLTNCVSLPVAEANATFTFDATSHPPLKAGRYLLTLCNPGPDPISVALQTSLGVDPNLPVPFRFTSVAPAPLADAALSRFSLNVTNCDPIAAVEVGVRLNHPRLSDLALSLVSPAGTRVLLQANRGGASFEGMGLEVLATNITPISSEGGPEASTNTFDTGQTAGTITLDYEFYSLPDTMHIYYEGNLIFDSDMVSGSGQTNISYGPGASTFLSIIMNEGGNFDSNTVWFYTVTSTRLVSQHLTFTENTNLASLPIKFASPPLTNFTALTANGAAENGLFYLPEESLRKFLGESPNGQWQLEIVDARPGAINPVPALVSWQLRLAVDQTLPAPSPLPPGQARSQTLGPGQIQWYSVEAPAWVSFATNRLWGAIAPVNLLFNAQRPPTGTNDGDVLLLSGVTAGSATLQTNALPSWLPGSGYYLGLQNPAPAPVTFTVAVDFDVAAPVTLLNSAAYAATNTGKTDFYRYVVSSNAVRAQFEVQQPAADLTLVLRKGLPLPGLTSYDQLSANPGTNDELIVCYDVSSPVPLTPGEWFLAVINPAGVPAAYSILVTEFLTYGTNLDILSQTVADESVCVTWASLPGAHYYVQGSDSLDDPNWVTLSPTVTAFDYQATYCLPLASARPFLRIQEGLVLTPPPVTLHLTPAGRLLQWTASATNQFKVQWTASLPTAAWNSFTNIVTSTSTTFFFLDDGSQTGGWDATRFYRLLRW